MMFFARQKVVAAVLLSLLLALSGLYSVCQAGEPSKTEAVETADNTFYDRIMKILKTHKIEEPPAVKPERKPTSIFGTPEVTKIQMISYIKRHNPQPKLTCSVEELVDTYFEEALAEGIRPDLALAQAILETGFFRFNGDVLPEQNNFAGIGSTGSGAKGIWFSTPQIGVRAHVQHLLAYASDRQPNRPVVDPRFNLVRSLGGYSAQCPTWESLSGKWAIPGINYGDNIIGIVEKVKASR